MTITFISAEEILLSIISPDRIIHRYDLHLWYMHPSASRCVIKVDVRMYISLGAGSFEPVPLIPAITIIAKFIEKPSQINEQSRQNGKHWDRVIETVLHILPKNAIVLPNLHETPRSPPSRKFVERETTFSRMSEVLLVLHEYYIGKFLLLRSICTARCQHYYWWIPWIYLDHLDYT